MCVGVVRVEDYFYHKEHEGQNLENAGIRSLALSTDKHLHKTNNGLFSTYFTYISPSSPKWLSSKPVSIIPHCLPCNRVLWINTGAELQFKITRPYRPSVLTCNKRVWANCRSTIFFLHLLHFDWWIGALNKGFWSFWNERHRESPRHSPEKKLIYFS